jgi:hypothetical protein
VLLAIAMWRRRAVPRWAAAAAGTFPFVGGVSAPAGAVLALAGFGACAVTLRRAAVEPSPIDTLPEPERSVNRKGANYGLQH